MPVVSFTFGSFGEISALLQLAWQLRAVLNDVRGASSEISALVEDIDGFTCGLQQVKAVIEGQDAHMQRDLKNGILHSLSACHDILLVVKFKIDSFRSRMIKGKGPEIWKHYWAVAAWSILGGKEEVDSLRVRLSEQLGRIQFYLSLSQSQKQEAIEGHAAQQVTRLDQIYELLREIPRRVTVTAPSFLLFDKTSNRYYQPCARTSFKRLLELVRETNQSTNPALEFGLRKDVYRSPRSCPSPDVAHLLYIAQAKMGPRDEDFADSVTLGSAWAPAMPVDCYFFKGVFDEWQVIIGIPPRAHARASGIVEYQQLLKTLLERRHSINEPCDCDGTHCSVRFQAMMLRRAYLKQALLAYSEAGTLLLSHVPSDGGSIWRERLLSVLRTYPDPEFVRSTVLPRLWKLEGPQGGARIDIQRGKSGHVAETTGRYDREKGQFESIAGHAVFLGCPLASMIRWLQDAPPLSDDKASLDFNFTVRDYHSHARVVVECRNAAMQMMMLL